MQTKGDTRVLWIIDDDRNFTPPLNVMLLSAIGKQNKPWRSSHLALFKKDNIIETVKALRPQIVAASVITGSHKYYFEALRAIKEELKDEVFIIAGGPHCSTYPEEITERKYLDAVGVFECDSAWPELLDALESDRQKVHAIPNILTKENCKERLVRIPIGNNQWETAVNPKFYQNRNADLDSLPFMDRGLIYDTTAFKSRTRRTHIAGRGCPFRCTYCFERDWNKAYAGKGKILQRYSVARFCEELLDVMRHYDTGFWNFYDDVFPTFESDIQWLREFAEVYPRMINMPFHCRTRCDLVMKNPEVLHLLKQAGVSSITMSVESGNQFIRDQIITRDMTEKEMSFAFGLARKLKIHTFANTILGIPGLKIPCPNDPRFNDKLQEIITDANNCQTIMGGRLKKGEMEALIAAERERFPDQRDFARSAVRLLRRMGLHSTQKEYDLESAYANINLGVGFGEFPILHPYPRTKITEWLIAKGYFDGDFDRLHDSYQNRSPLNCFTEKEKTYQQNLALLAVFCIVFSGSFNKVLNWLAKPISKICLSLLARAPYRIATMIYLALYFISKTYIEETRIYPTKRAFRKRIRLYMEIFRLDLWKQFAWEKLPEDKRPGQTLGGPVPM